jgi:NAD(P)H-dependent flavin oxidoreductase YrpB (nitropropane dioxygenase family)
MFDHVRSSEAWATMIRTSLVDTFDLSCPVLSAGMPFAGCPRLVAAVSNAGGMGFLGAAMTSAPEVTDMIRATRHLTSRPFGVSFSTPFVTNEQVERCAHEKPAVVVFSRDQPHRHWMEELQSVGIAVWRHVASPAEGRVAAEQGANAVIVDGGAISSTPPYWALVNLLPAIAEAVSPLPTIAAGGIGDGRRLAAALVLGADAAWCGARFLASKEVRELQRKPSIRDAVRFTAGRPDSDFAASPTPAGLFGGTPRGSVTAHTAASWEIKSAGEIVRELSDEASAVLNALYSTLGGAAPRRD